MSFLFVCVWSIDYRLYWVWSDGVKILFSTLMLTNFCITLLFARCYLLMKTSYYLIWWGSTLSSAWFSAKAIFVDFNLMMSSLIFLIFSGGIISWLLNSELSDKAPLVRFELAQLLHESLVRLRFLPLCLAVLEGVVHWQSKSAHHIHDESCGTATLTHGAMNEHSVLPGWIAFVLQQLVIMLHDSTVLHLLIVHLNLSLVRLIIQHHCGRWIRVCHLSQVDIVDLCLLVARLCITAHEFKNLGKHILNRFILLIGHD